VPVFDGLRADEGDNKMGGGRGGGSIWHDLTRKGGSGAPWRHAGKKGGREPLIATCSSGGGGWPAAGHGRGRGGRCRTAWCVGRGSRRGCPVGEGYSGPAVLGPTRKE
jgi:hypothetical protein